METGKTIDDVIEALTQYYEAAGFKDVYSKRLKGKNEEEVRKLYLDILDITKT